MTRVSTIQNYNIMTSNLMKAQIRQNDVGAQVSSQKVANDLKGYAKNAEILTAMRGTQNRINGLLDQSKQVMRGPTEPRRPARPSPTPWPPATPPR